MIRITTHSKRKFIYEFIDAIGFLFFLSVFILAIGQIMKNAFIEKFSAIFRIFFIIGFIWILIRFFIGRIKWYKPIDITGEIDFYNDYLTFKNIKVQVDRIKTIRIRVTQCKGQPAGRYGLSDGAGNYIEILLKDKSKLKTKLFIENIQQVNDLKLLMNSWREKGIMVIGYWKPFLHIFQK